MSLRKFVAQFTLLSRNHQCNRHFVRLRRRSSAPDILEKHLDTELNPTLTSKMTMVSQQECDLVFITRYSGLGFGLNNGMKLAGPTVFFPRSCLKWKIHHFADINEKSLGLFTILTPKLDLLIIGTGSTKRELDPGTIKFLRKHQLPFEVMASDQAIPAFNFQNNDQCWIAAAIVPPEHGSNHLVNYVQNVYKNILDGTDMVYQEEKDLAKIESNQDGGSKRLKDSSVKGGESKGELTTEDGNSENANEMSDSECLPPPLGQSIDFMSSAALEREDTVDENVNETIDKEKSVKENKIKENSTKDSKTEEKKQE